MAFLLVSSLYILVGLPIFGVISSLSLSGIKSAKLIISSLVLGIGSFIGSCKALNIESRLPLKILIYLHI